MKLLAIAPLFGLALAAAANLVGRQVSCSEDNCYRAVWGLDRGILHIRSAVIDCQSWLITTVRIHPV